MRNIYFYIHKTGIIDYFIYPICKFLLKEYNITILHLNKKNGFANKEYAHIHQIDISDYNTRQILDLFHKDKPIAFVLPGFISIYELYMLRLAKMSNTPTLFLEHGIYSRDTAHIAYKKAFTSKVLNILSRNIYFLYRYIEMAVKSKRLKEELSILYKAIRKKDYSGTQFTHAFFFAPYGYKHIDQYFHHSPHSVEFIGYPLVENNTEYNNIKQLIGNDTRNGVAIYIHQPFILDTITDWNYDQEKEMLIKLNNDIKQHNLSLVVALHPRESLQRYSQLYSDTDIAVKYITNKEEYAYCDLAIGHYSTALMFPLFFEKPIWIIDYNAIKSTQESPYIPVNSYPNLQTHNNNAFKNEIIGNETLSFENIAQHIDQYLQSL